MVALCFHVRWILLSSHTYTCTGSDEILFFQDGVIDEAYPGIYIGEKKWGSAGKT